MKDSINSKTVENVLMSASKLASYNMILQLCFRVLTFMLNAFILRYISKDTLGVVNVRLMLLYSTILFMSREAFRRACLSTDAGTIEKGDGKQRWICTINLLWCILPLGLVCASLCIYSWILLLENPDPQITPHYSLAVLVFGCCAWIELVVEPLWVVAQAFLFIKLRVLSEGFAILMKSIVTVLLVLYFPGWGLISFCIAQVSFAISYISIFYIYFGWYVTTANAKQMDDFPFRSIRDFFPKFLEKHSFVNGDVAKLTISFFKQSALKQLLTEGERYIMTILNVLSFADQGIYDIVNNLGSLAARFIFLPIEESFYLFFTKTLRRGKLYNEQAQGDIAAVSNVLFCLLRLVVLIGLIILAFGVPYASLALDIYGGNLLSSGAGPILLKFYCLYVLVIAINGTTECFVFAAMSEDEVDRYNKKMLLFSCLFLTASYYLTRAVGSVGFILANCLNMFLRIVHSIIYTNRFYRGVETSPLRGLLPDWMVLFSLLLSSAVCLFSDVRFCCDRGLTSRIAHLFIGGIFFLFCCVVIWFRERSVIDFVQRQFFKRHVE